MRDSDPVDSLLLMRVGLYFGPACFFILTALWTKLLVEGTISTGVFVVLVVANVPITLAGIALIYGGRGDRLTVGLALFAGRYRGTPHGEAAARELKERKAEARG